MRKVSYEIKISEYTSDKTHNTELEKRAKRELKKVFQGKWEGAEIVADVKGDRVVFEMRGDL